MRLHSDTINPMHIIHALQECKARGLIADHVELANIERKGSRKRRSAVEFSIGTSDGTSFMSEPVREELEAHGLERKAMNAAKRRWVRNGYARQEDFPRSATWHEWGHLIAYLFRLDPDAIIGAYDGWIGFERETFEAPAAYQWRLHHNGRCYPFMHDLEDVQALPMREEVAA